MSTIQVRRGLSHHWTANNPTLAAGEIGYETDTNKFKIGDGSTAWTSLSYFTSGGGLANIVEDTTPQLGGDLDLNGFNIDFPSTSNISDVLDEDNMASNSATALATQQSIKAYVDANAGGTSYIYDVTDYGALGDGVDNTDGAITATDATFTSASSSFVAGDVGKIIAISGAGTGGNYHVTTIASINSSTSVELTDVAVTTVSSKIFYYGTDDTTAIQDTINAAFDAGGGVVFVPNGIYVLNGALQNNIGTELIDYNSQLYIPYEIYQVPTRRVIKILGETPPMLYQSNGIGNAKPTNTGVIFRSTIVGTGTYPSVLASRGDSAAPLSEYNYTGIEIENLQIQLTPITTSNKISMGGINFGYQGAGCHLNKVTCFPYNIWLGDTLEPSVTIAGIYMPLVDCEHGNICENTELGGFTDGYISGEHTYFKTCVAVACTNAFKQTNNNEPSYFNHIMSYWCENAFVVTGTSVFKVSLLDTEWDNTGKWYDDVYTISDPNNYGSGEITLSIVEAGVGVNNTKLSKEGGNKIRVHVIGRNNTTKSGNYTLTLPDVETTIQSSSSTGATFTIPLESSVPFHYGSKINFIQGSQGQITFAQPFGLRLLSAHPYRTRSIMSKVQLEKFGSDKWILSGDLETIASASIPTANLIRFYKFENDATDEQGLGDGTATSITYTTGWVGTYSAVFAGGSNYITIPDAADLSFGNGTTDSAFSITMWMYINALDGETNNDTVLVKRASATNREYQISFVSDLLRFILFDQSTGGTIQIQTTRDFDPTYLGGWFHLGFTYDGSSAYTGMKIYYNGEELAVTDVSSGSYTAMENGTENIVLGTQSWNVGNSSFNGRLDNLRIFDAELTPEEMWRIYMTENSGL